MRTTGRRDGLPEDAPVREDAELDLLPKPALESSQNAAVPATPTRDELIASTEPAPPWLHAAPAPDTTRAPEPSLSPLTGQAVSKDPATLWAMTPARRGEVLARLGIEHRRAGESGDPARADAATEAMKRVLDATDRLALEQTVRSAATAGTLGFIVEEYGLDHLIALGDARGTNLNDLLATTDTVHQRGLTTDEARAIRTNFAGTLDPSTIRMHFTTGAQTMGAAALVLGNTLHVDPTSSRWGFRPGTTLPSDPDSAQYQEVLLAHEPTHIWSYQHQGTQYAINSLRSQLGAIGKNGDRDGAYTWEPGQPSYFSYGEEQRAMIVQDYVTAKRALARGETWSWMDGAERWVVPEEYLRKLEPYLRELRDAGPGQPQPLTTPSPRVCVGPAPRSRQDGVAQALAEKADGLIAEAGHSSLKNLQSHDPLTQVAGAAGVAGVVAASLLPREQNEYEGAHGGGTALLDQAGIPRGLELETDQTKVAARLGYDAGFENPRAELSATAHGNIGPTRVSAEGSATVGLDGAVQKADGRVELKDDAARLEVGGGYQRLSERSDRVHGRVTAEAGDVSLQARGFAERKSGELTSAHLEGRLDAPDGSVEGTVDLGAQGVMKRATVDASARVGAANVGAGVTLTPKGVDAARASIGAPTAIGTVSANAFAEDLTGKPKVGGGAALTRHDVSVQVSGTKDTATGEAQVQVGVKVPLD